MNEIHHNIVPIATIPFLYSYQLMLNFKRPYSYPCVPMEIKAQYIPFSTPGKHLSGKSDGLMPYS